MTVVPDRQLGWVFIALGLPAPQGSKAFKGMAGGHAILVESSKRVKPWRESVLTSAFGIGPRLDGPILARMIFTLPRPKSAPRRVRSPWRTPDLSKLARSTEDAITGAGLWADDARVVAYERLAKVYPGFDAESLPVPGVVVAAVPAGVESQLEESVQAAIGVLWAHYERGNQHV